MKNVKLFNIGISDSEEELFISNNMGSMNRIIHEASHDNCELVQTTTLDKLLIFEQNISIFRI